MRKILWITAAAVIVYGSVGCSGSDSLPSAATPTFSPAAGTYTTQQAVTLACTTPGATVYYTTDGSSPTTGSNAYSDPIAISTTTTIKAIAVASGYTGSAIANGTYTINLPTQTATPTFAPTPGTYTSQQSIALSCETAGATIYYTLDGSAPTTSSTVYASPITVSATTTVKVLAVASGFTESGIASGVYTITPPGQVATPSFTPAAGTYPSAQSVNLSCTTAGATIYYTLNGATPTTASTVYANQITVSSTTTIKAVAAMTGLTTSEVASGTFTITATTPVPSCGSNNQYVQGCFVGEACHPGYENAYCGWTGGPCLACPAECYCLFGHCWYKATGEPCSAPYSRSQQDVPPPCTGCVASDGVCQPGGTANLCGTGGAVCATCGPGQTCTAGACVPALSCTGCVQDGLCYPGDSQLRCGTGGKPCTACAWRGENCLAGKCETNVTSCTWDNKYFPGCYVGNACYPGYENAYCGEHGGPCLACPAECYCYGLCWYKDTGQPCPAPYAK